MRLPILGPLLDWLRVALTRYCPTCQHTPELHTNGCNATDCLCRRARGTW